MNRAALASLCLLAACTPPTPDEHPASHPPAHMQQHVDTLPTPLTDTQGDAETGRRIFVDRDRGHCVLCHQIDGLDAEFQGNVGPALTGIGNRRTSAELRLRIVNNAALNPDTVMPPYYRTDGLTNVDPAFAGKPMLPAQDIEDLIAYLASLKEDPA